MKVFLQFLEHLCAKYVSFEGRGFIQITLLLHKPYFVKVSMMGEGIKNIQKFALVVYGLQGINIF